MKKNLTAAFVTLPVMLMACGVLAQANDWNKSTKITVDQPIEVPGAVLPPGTYIFKLVDSPSDRHVVQVFNEREDHVFASIIAIPNYRLTPTGHTVITFYEVPAGQPQPVRAWFYPGDNFGQEFVYPKERNLYVAQTTDTTTTTPAPAVVETQTAQQTEVAQVETPPAPAPAPVEVAPAPEPVVVAANEPPPAPMPTAAAPVMPQTGSNVPLFALLGFLTVGAALSIGAFSKQRG